MAAFVLASAADKDGLGSWTAGGGASSLLDGVQANDSKYAVFDAGADESHILRIGVEAPAGMPSEVEIVIRHVIESGSPSLSFIDLHDAAGNVLFQLFPGQAVPGVEADEVFALTQVYGGVPDISGDWHIDLTYYASPSGAAARVDQVSGSYDGAGGAGGTGPGGQLGQHAAVLIPTMVSP